MFPETAISQNQDRALITEDHKQKTTLLTKHLAHLEKEKTVQVKMSRDTRKPVFGVSYQVDTNRAVQQHKIARNLKLRI